jgi:hypothetical protein
MTSHARSRTAWSCRARAGRGSASACKALACDCCACSSVSRVELFSFHVITVAGCYEGPNREFNWPIVDQEFNQFALQQLDEVDTLLLGRVTYQFMASDWPTRRRAGRPQGSRRR